MSTQESQESHERQQTDDSLREEREKADVALEAIQGAVEDKADAVVERARENADAVLVAARDKADEQADPAAAYPVPSAAIAEEREVEDETLRDERAEADERVRRERQVMAGVLSRHLPLERHATDKHLLTERARSDDALAMRDDFLGMVSHDLRDLLNGIVVTAAMLGEKLAKRDDSQKLVNETVRIQRYGARMTRLIGDLIDVASIDAGKLAVCATQCDAILLVGEAVDALRTAAEAKSLSLVVEPMEPSLPADFDHDRILQVLANLIANSIKFTSKGGSIRVRCESSGSGLLFCVSDTGGGIAENMLEAVFERFWQVGKNDYRGLGLGLYISRRIVEAHGGSIWAESKVGEGTRMFFTFPITAST